MKIYLKEGLSKTDRGRITPDSKYYAFDWDDNIVHMPTKILLKNDKDETVEMSTQDFEIFKSKIGKEPFNYKGNKIVGPDENFLYNFSEKNDDSFIPDSEVAKPGPAFDDFKEAINNGSIFSIITARGHNPETIKKAIYNYIMTGFGGIDKDELVKNLRRYRKLSDLSGKMTTNNLIKWYLSLNKYYTVAYKNPNVDVPKAKVNAMKDFIRYTYKKSNELDKKAFLKNRVSNNFLPNRISIGFSDDSRSNAAAMSKNIKSTPEYSFKTYFTGKGSKEEI